MSRNLAKRTQNHRRRIHWVVRLGFELEVSIPKHTTLTIWIRTMLQVVTALVFWYFQKCAKKFQLTFHLNVTFVQKYEQKMSRCMTSWKWDLTHFTLSKATQFHSSTGRGGGGGKGCPRVFGCQWVKFPSNFSPQVDLIIILIGFSTIDFWYGNSHFLLYSELIG